MHRFHSLKSSHLVMWSSPILLVVLVFTLTSSSNLRPTVTPMTVTTSVTTTTSTTTSTSTTPTSLVVTPTTRAVAPAHSVTSTVRSSVNNFAAVTPTTAPNSAWPPRHVVSSGVFSGKIDASLNVVDVPLAGPSSWRLVASAPTNQTLTCDGQSSTIGTSISVGAHQTCQLEITAATPGTAIAWQLSQTS